MPRITKIIRLVQGVSGPNLVNNSTATNLTGVLLGNGTTVAVATASQLRAAMGIQEFPNLAAANLQLANGDPYFDTGAGKMRTATN